MVAKKPKIALKLLRAEDKTEKKKSRISRVPEQHAELVKKLKGNKSALSLGSASSQFRSTSSIGLDFKDRGNFTHLRHKEIKYTFQHKAQKKDPFFYVDVGTDCETFFIGQKARAQYRLTEHFAYIVDLDNYEYHKVVFHSFLNEILQSSYFRHGILFLVLVNAVLIGLATLQKLKPYEGIFDIIDMVILSVFIFEVIIKWIYDFRLFWTVLWNCLDFFIIGLTMMASVVPLGNQGDSANIAVRVVRTFRSLRCVSSFTSLSIVSHTVVKSGLDMGNILLVLIIIMLVLSVMAVILFDIEDLEPQRFLDGLDAWYILFICVTQDGWAEILNGYEKTTDDFYIIACYLIFAVCVGAFIFANLIVAVIVANLELSVKELRQESKKYDNPLEFIGEGIYSGDVEIIPVYDLLAKNNFVCISQRPLKIPRLRRMSTRRMQIYVSLIVALEQNMLEAEIIALDLEKIIAVILSIIVQIDVNTGKIAKKDKEEALKKLAKLAEMAEKAKKDKRKSKVSGDGDDQTSQSTEQSQPQPMTGDRKSNTAPRESTTKQWKVPFVANNRGLGSQQRSSQQPLKQQEGNKTGGVGVGRGNNVKSMQPPSPTPLRTPTSAAQIRSAKGATNFPPPKRN